jgi:alpha,alpha-trehalose-phosphate synthase [UDP-forming]
MRGCPMSGFDRLIIVSNRLPITVESVKSEKLVIPSSGGLVSALAPILKDGGGCWVGWTGTEYQDMIPELVAHWGSTQGYSLVPVFLTEREQRQYYRGFCNEIIWPLFHGLPFRSQLDSVIWQSYCEVNRKFADAVEGVAEPGDFIWVHDYHLMMCADALRKGALQHRLAYFHHIPFPAPDIFEVLPWRAELLRALLEFDVVGFQTHRDRRNFISCLRRFLPNVRLHRGGEISIARVDSRATTLGTYPISIDCQLFAAADRQPAIAKAAATLRGRLGQTRVMLGVDRLDYTKGIPSRLMAFEKFLERNPDLSGEVTLVQIVVPSRSNIAEYADLRHRIEVLVSRINGSYGMPGWVPINYFYRSFSRDELITFYRAADIAVVTPLKDGMNLVAKEFCASRSDGTGVLILSEFAGAAAELKCGALLVNPHDTDGFVSAMEEALEMDEAEQRRRMRAIQSHLKTHDVFDWCRSLTIMSFDEPQDRRFFQSVG